MFCSEAQRQAYSEASSCEPFQLYLPKDLTNSGFFLLSETVCPSHLQKASIEAIQHVLSWLTRGPVVLVPGGGCLILPIPERAPFDVPCLAVNSATVAQQPTSLHELIVTKLWSPRWRVGIKQVCGEIRIRSCCCLVAGTILGTWDFSWSNHAQIRLRLGSSGED